MTETTTTQLDSVAVSLKEGAAKLADHFKQQAALKSELHRSASEAEAAGFQEFADILHEMAAKLGGISPHNSKDPAASTRRRGRPPKPADEQSGTA